jgi:hypothetical protein
MAFEDEYGITIIEIVPKMSKLEISLDEGFPDTTVENVPVLLYVPNGHKGRHNHIVLTQEGARELHNWLGKYLESNDVNTNNT